MMMPAHCHQKSTGQCHTASQQVDKLHSQGNTPCLLHSCPRGPSSFDPIACLSRGARRHLVVASCSPRPPLPGGWGVSGCCLQGWGGRRGARLG